MKIYKPLAMSEIGRRSNQEDAIFPAVGKATVNDRLFIVCDGMGGHESGEVASNCVVQSISSCLKDVKPGDFSLTNFSDALSYAYEQLDALDNIPNNKKRMGTTLTFLYLGDKNILIAHIGDSRVYQLRQSSDGNVEIVHKTEDHSLVNDYVKAKLITPQEAKIHPQKNIITRAMQPHLEQRCKATTFESDNVKAGDYFFLCSDGVIESIDDDMLINILGEPLSNEEKLNKIKEICSLYSNDNHTAYLIQIAEGLKSQNVNSSQKQSSENSAINKFDKTAKKEETEHLAKKRKEFNFKWLIIAITILTIIICVILTCSIKSS